MQRAGREGRGVREGPPPHPLLSSDSIHSLFPHSRPGLWSFGSKSNDHSLPNWSSHIRQQCASTEVAPSRTRAQANFQASMHFKDDSLYITVCVCVCAQKLSVSNSLSLHGLYPWDFSAHGIPRQKYCSGLPFPPPGESSWPKGRTRVSWVSGSGRQILYHWATSEAQVYSKYWNEVNRIREEKYYLV